MILTSNIYLSCCCCFTVLQQLRSLAPGCDGKRNPITSKGPMVVESFYARHFSAGWHCHNGAYLLSRRHFTFTPTSKEKQLLVYYTDTHAASRVGLDTAGKGAAARAQSHHPQPVWPADVRHGCVRTTDCRMNTRKRTKPVSWTNRLWRHTRGVSCETMKDKQLIQGCYTVVPLLNWKQTESYFETESNDTRWIECEICCILSALHFH